MSVFYLKSMSLFWCISDLLFSCYHMVPQHPHYTSLETHTVYGYVNVFQLKGLVAMTISAVNVTFLISKWG